MGVLADWQIRRDIGIEPFAEGIKRDGQISSGVSAYGYDARLGYKFQVFQPYPGPVIDPKAFDPTMLREVDLTPGNNPQHGYDLGADRCKWCNRSAAIMDFTGHCPGARYILIPAHSFVLAESLETIKIPRDVLCVVLGKSTYARCGLIVNVTPLEPEWEGKVTIELSNTTPLPMKVYCGEGIMQLVFLRSDGWREWIWRKLRAVWWAIGHHGELDPGHKNPLVSCDKSYADKKGRYQGQAGLTLPTVDKKDS